MSGVGSVAAPSNVLVAGIAGDTKWSDVTLTYSLGDDLNDLSTYNANSIKAGSYSGTYRTLDGSNALEVAMIADIRWAFNSIQAVSGISFAETTDFQGSGTDLKIMTVDNLVSSSGSGLNGTGTFPGTDPFQSATDFESYTLLDSARSSMTTMPETGGSSNRLHTTIHEIGHSLGLGHPHDTGTGSGSWASSAITNADNVLDNDRYTIMSYERGGLDVNLQSQSFGYAVTPMALDIAALHRLYGSNANHTGNTIYTLTDAGTTTRDLDGNDGSVSIGRAFYGIWDTGGNDEITYSGSNHALINLNEATLDQSADPVEITELLADLQSSALFDTILPAATAGELRDDLLDNDHHAGGFFSRIFTTGGNADLGGYSIANSSFATGGQTTVIENATGGNQSDILVGNEQSNYLNGQGGNDLILGGRGSDTLVGYTGADELFGGDDNDTLQGDAGADILNGGSGTDTASYGTATSGLIADLQNSTNNTGDAAGDSYNSIENTSGSNYNDSLYGNSGANKLKGLVGNDFLYGRGNNDVLIGGSGGDVLSGGSGTDTADYSDATGGVTADLFSPGANTGFAAGDTYLSIENLTGSNFNDVLHGTTEANTIKGDIGNDRLFGDAGNDILVGGKGQDELRGGSGTDRADYTDATSGLLADLQNTVANTGFANGDTYFLIEDLGGSDFNDNLFGNGQDNMLFGNIGNDNLYGRGGWDVFLGGAGSDLLNGGSGTDQADYSDALAGLIADLQLTGANTGFANGDTYTSIENLKGTGFTDSLFGDGSGNTIWGSDGDDNLYGRGGNDSLRGQIGNDTLIGGSGDDTLDGSVGADELQGNSGKDKMYAGTDAEHDVFVFKSISDSIAGSQRDILFQFDSGEDDIDLSAIDADTSAGGNQAFAFNGSVAQANSIWLVDTGTDIIVRGDVNGDTTVDFEIELASIISLDVNDFVL